MTKEEQKVVDQYCKEYNIDHRTTSMIIHHYIDIGERQASKLSPELIEKYYAQLVKEEKEIEASGKISLITPDFTRYLLKACMGLNKLPMSIRYKFIKEHLV